ncbi:ATP-binding cassette domain-containing protein [Shimia litoralis]|uniref:ATP-binding cassette domain-containing protein n=1 Tax=Shimia litoralis TaxID=420403 RepID=A0A4V6F144_9RHOB|nr:ATP-binding cassette domain-containing protein [Shimia litoralis]TKZ17241.1 ATP-binding cassette domain-containing protein [Shimia litoralis]
MLTLEKLRVQQGDFDLSADFSLQEGARTAVLGPSGAGKSTLLGMIAGFVQTMSGRVLFRGDDITHATPGARPIAMLFQDNNLFPHLDVTQNVGLGVTPDLRLSADQKAKVFGALDRVGLAEFATRKPAALSGGQQSRVALARILVQDRPLILLDEPFAALGPALKAEMLDLVSELALENGATLMMVSHDPADARRITDQTILVADGVAHGPQPTATLLDNPPPALQAYLG